MILQGLITPYPVLKLAAGMHSAPELLQTSAFSLATEWRLADLLCRLETEQAEGGGNPYREPLGILVAVAFY